MKTRFVLFLLFLASAVGAQNLTIYSTNIVFQQGTIPTCGAGAYVGYVRYDMTIAQGWGWKTNSYPMTIEDTNTILDRDHRHTLSNIVVATGINLDVTNSCYISKLTLSQPTPSGKYRFASYLVFTNGIDKNKPYPLLLTGFVNTNSP